MWTIKLDHERDWRYVSRDNGDVGEGGLGWMLALGGAFPAQMLQSTPDNPVSASILHRKDCPLLLAGFLYIVLRIATSSSHLY